MTPTSMVQCLGCSFKTEVSEPFCLECGEPSPRMAVKGPFAVELREVASAAARRDSVGLLRSWFPALDPLATEERLAKGRYTLLAGVDEVSASRIIRALKDLKVDARMTRADAHKNWPRLLFNGGLLWTAGGLALGVLLPGVLSLLFIFLGLAVPVGIAIKNSDRLVPMVPAVPPREHSEALVELAGRYGEVIGRLGQEDRQLLMGLMRTIFGLIADLERGSLASAAAGKERGDLYYQLFDAAVTTVELGRRIAEERPYPAADLRKELEALESLIQDTGQWFRAQDQEQLKPGKEFAVELEYVKESIDRILQDIRTPDHAARVEPEKKEKVP